MTRILVTGGGGFIARYLLPRLAEGAHDLHAVDLTQPTTQIPDVTTYSGDIQDDGSMATIFEQARPEIVIHLAGALGAHTGTRPYASDRVNVQGTAGLLELSRRHGVRRFVFSSSIAVYGGQRLFGDEPVTEDSPCVPLILYGAQKLYCEHLIRAFSRSYGMQGIAVRIGTVFGHGRTTGYGRANGEIISLPALGRPVQVPMTPSQRWAFIYVEDVADLICRIVASDRVSADVYNTGGDSLSAEDFACLIKKELPAAEISFSPTDSTYVNVHRVSAHRAERDFGFIRRPLPDGIRAHIRTARMAAQASPSASRV